MVGKRSGVCWIGGLLGLGLAAVLPPAGLGQAGARAEAVEQTPVAAAAARLTAALGADHAARVAFVRDGLSARALADTPAADWVGLLDKVAGQTGGLAIVEVRPGATPRFMEATARAAAGGRFARLVIGVTREDPTRIGTLYILPARDPAKVRAEAWPEGGVVAARLPAEIDRRVKSLAYEDLFSGVVLVARGDRVIYRKAYGWADRSIGAPNRPATRFNLGSVGKMFTGAAAAQLIAQGRLSPDDTVGKWLPNYPGEAGRRITVGQLLTHTSGLGDFFGPDYAAARGRFDAPASYFPLFASHPLDFEPGARFGYSNAGYTVLGAIIEAASGETYEAYLRRHVFAPAAMTATGFPRTDRHARDQAVGYYQEADDPLGLGPRRPNDAVVALKGNPAGGAFASADDVFAFTRAMRTGQLMPRAAADLALAPKVDFPGAPRPAKYAWGFDIEDCAGHAVFGHGGGGPSSGVSAVVYAARDGAFTVVVLSNYDPPVASDLAASLCEVMGRQDDLARGAGAHDVQERRRVSG